MSASARLESSTAAKGAFILRGAMELTQSHVGVMARIRRTWGQPIEIQTFVDVGWAGEAQRQAALTAIFEPGHFNPALEGTLDRATDSHMRQRSFTRRDVVDDETWYESAHVHDVRRPSQIDDCVYSIYPLPETGHYACLGLHKGWGDLQRFGERERLIADYLWQSLGWLHESPLEPTRRRRENELPQELNATFEMLRSAVQLTDAHRKLGLSRAEFKRLAAAVYDHFHVSTRLELLVQLSTNS